MTHSRSPPYGPMADSVRITTCCLSIRHVGDGVVCPGTAPYITLGVVPGAPELRRVRAPQGLGSAQRRGHTNSGTVGRCV